jgi:excisionase family DNA binding protein
VSGKLLDAAGVAQLLAVPRSWVLEHARAGTIPHYRLGRYVRFDEDDVRAWVESCRQGGRPTKLRRYDRGNSPGGAGTPRGATPKE